MKNSIILRRDYAIDIFQSMNQSNNFVHSFFPDNAKVYFYSNLVHLIEYLLLVFVRITNENHDFVTKILLLKLLISKWMGKRV